ncbi:13862_t:CDS:1, partial [Cetraspora pellucida]
THNRRKKKNNQDLLARSTNSTNVELIDQFETISNQEMNTEYVKIDCLEVGDFIADRIQELIESAGTDG